MKAEGVIEILEKLLEEANASNVNIGSKDTGACVYVAGASTKCAVLTKSQCDQLGGVWTEGEECPETKLYNKQREDHCPNVPHLDIDWEFTTWGPDNPNYYIHNSDNSQPVKLVVCSETVTPGAIQRKFRNFTIEPQSKIILGCKFENGTVRTFSIHWQRQGKKEHPDVTDAKAVIESCTRGCDPDGTCAWVIRNNHYFKPVKVEYSYRGKEFLEYIDPMDTLSMLGASKSPPFIKNVEYYTGGYHDFSCG